MVVCLCNRTPDETKIIEIPYTKAMELYREYINKCTTIQLFCGADMEEVMENNKRFKPFVKVNELEELIKQ